MSFVLLLSIATAIIVLLTIAAWRKTKSISVPLGIVILYYWSLYGAWVIIYENLGGDSYALGFKLRYMFDVLFEVHLDGDYFITLVLYSLFIIVVLVTLLCYVRRPKGLLILQKRPLRLDHWKLLSITTLAAVISFIIMKEYIISAALQNIAVYVATRSDIASLFTLHQVLSRAALVPGSIGLAIYFSGSKGKYIIGCGQKSFILCWYLLLLGGMFAFSLILGNRNELFTSVVVGLLVYLANSPAPKRKRLFILGTGCMCVLGLIQAIRHIPLSEMASRIDSETLIRAFRSLYRSNEAFSAHVSLYGLIHNDVPFIYGYSLYTLFLSIVPHILWTSRPSGSYTVYAEYVLGGQEVVGQGYTIHHAAAWYFNFGVIGVVVGGMLLGWIWAACMNRFFAGRGTRVFGRLFSILSPWTLVAVLPVLIRAGPEAYKGIILMAFLIPIIVLGLASVRFVLYKGKPSAKPFSKLPSST